MRRNPADAQDQKWERCTLFFQLCDSNIGPHHIGQLKSSCSTKSRNWRPLRRTSLEFSSQRRFNSASNVTPLMLHQSLAELDSTAIMAPKLDHNSRCIMEKCTLLALRLIANEGQSPAEWQMLMRWCWAKQ